MAGYSVTYTVVDQATAQINNINKRIQQLRAPLEKQAQSMSKFIDVSGLRAVENGFKRIAGAVTSTASAMAKIVPAFGALTGAATIAGIGKLVTDFGNLAAELTKTGALLDETPERLSGVAQAMRSIGGNAQTAIDALVELKNTTYDAALGMNSVAASAFARLGVAIVDTKNNFRDVIDVEGDLFKALDQMPNAMDRQREALRVGGQALADTYQQYKLAGITEEEWIRRQKEMETLNKDRTRTFLQFEQSLAKVNTAFYDLGVKVAGAVAPALTEVFGVLSNYLDQHKDEIAAEVKGMGDAFLEWIKSGSAKKLADDFGTLLGVLVKIVETLAKIIRYMGDVSTRFSGLPTAADILNDSPLAKGLSDEQKRAILGADPQGAHATPNLFPGFLGGETPAAREERIRKQLGVPAPAAGAPAPAPAATPTPATPGLQGATGGAPAAFKAAIEQVESGGRNIMPTPGHSATGPRQMMPDTFAAWAKPGERIDNPEDNRRASDRLIDHLWTKYGGDPQKVAYAYANGSISSPDRNPGYAGKVMAAYGPTVNQAGGGVSPPGGVTGIGGKIDDVLGQMESQAGTRGPAVRQFLRDPHGVLQHDPDLGNWCAEYVNGYLQHLGIQGTTGSDRLMAASFLKWGNQIDIAKTREGDVLLNKNLAPGQAHVGVATGKTWLNTPGHKVGEVEEYSSNSIGPNGELLNLPGYRWRSDVNARRSDQLAALQAQGPNGTLVAGGGMPNGNVNIDINHKNAPAGVSVAANLVAGGGINVNPPRVEHQSFGSI